MSKQAQSLRPRLRPGLSAARDPRQPNIIHLFDTWRQSPASLALTLWEFHLVERMTGEFELEQLLSASLSLPASGGARLVEELVRRLDEGLYLDGPRWQERVAAPVREPTCIGCYAGDAEQLRQQMFDLFTDRQASGLPNERVKPQGNLRAVLAPHIDYARGGRSYTWAFKELVEQTNTSLFVIIGTSHYSRHRFTLTRKHFKTPLGVVPTDGDYIDRLERHYGPGLFHDEIGAHFPEHSIELEVVPLQYLLGERRPLRIVPILVGSFHDAVHERESPVSRNDIGRMVKALRAVEAELPERPAYIISGDLAHIGPKFGDPEPVDASWLEQSRSQDQALIRHAERGDWNRYFQTIADEGDRRRICGLPPTYTLLEALAPRSGKLLHYDQYVHPEGYESVSFASMAFYE